MASTARGAALSALRALRQRRLLVGPLRPHSNPSSCICPRHPCLRNGFAQHTSPIRLQPHLHFIYRLLSTSSPAPPALSDPLPPPPPASSPSPPSLTSLVPVVHHPLQQRISSLLLRLESSSSLPLPPSHRLLLSDSRHLLPQPFHLVVCGEFNSSKSSLINALLHATSPPLLPVGPLPTTANIYIIRYGPAITHTTTSTSLTPSSPSSPVPIHLITAPVPWLRTLSLIDTPGTNALHRVHEALTRDFLPRADLILLVTSSERPFSQSERTFLADLVQWKKRVGVVVSKADLLANADERRAVEDYVRKGVSEVLGMDGSDLPVFMVSTREPASLVPLDRYVKERVGVEGVWLKLRSPLGVIDRVLGDVGVEVQRDERVWGLKAEAVREVEGANADYRKASQEEFDRAQLKVTNTFLRMQDRSLRWIAEYGSLFKAWDWVQGPGQMQQRYTQEVWTDVREEIERALVDLLDGLAECRTRHLRRIQSRLQRTQDDLEHNSQHQVLRTLQASTADILASQQAPASPSSSSAISSALGTSLFASAALNTGAVSLAVASLLSLSVIDLTMMSSGLLALVGLGLMPWRRRVLGDAIRVKSREMQERLVAVMKMEMEAEVERVEKRVRRGIEALVKEVETEGRRVKEAQREVVEVRTEWRELTKQVEGLQPNRVSSDATAA